MSNKNEIRPSLLDRLASNAHAYESEWGYSITRLKECLQRDLGILLNTRSRFITPPAQFTHLQSTVLNYGLPDLGSINLASDRGKAELVNMIDNALRCYEPRFKSLRVQFVANDSASGLVRFRIEALMHADPVPEMVAFDTVLDTTEKTVDLKEAPI